MLDAFARHGLLRPRALRARRRRGRRPPRRRGRRAGARRRLRAGARRQARHPPLRRVHGADGRDAGAGGGRLLRAAAHGVARRRASPASGSAASTPSWRTSSSRRSSTAASATCTCGCTTAHNAHHILEALWKAFARAHVGRLARRSARGRRRAVDEGDADRDDRGRRRGAGNLRSVAKALEATGTLQPVRVTSDADVVRDAARVVVPGQGAFGDCASALCARRAARRRAIRDRIRAGKPYLGICLGLQVLFQESARSRPAIRGLGIFRGRVRRLPSGTCDEDGRRLKVPHIGWSARRGARRRTRCSTCRRRDNWFYFVHSYHAQPVDESLIAAVAAFGEHAADGGGRARQRGRRAVPPGEEPGAPGSSCLRAVRGVAMLIVPAIDLLGGNVVRLLQGQARVGHGVLERARRGGARVRGGGGDAGARGRSRRRVRRTATTARRSQAIVDAGRRGAGRRRRARRGGRARAARRGRARDRARHERGQAARAGARRCAASSPGRVVVAVDAHDGKVAVEGWAEATDIDACDLAARAVEWGAAAILYTDISRDGTGVGPNVERRRRSWRARSIRCR